MIEHTPGPWIAHCVDVQGERQIGDNGVRYWAVEPVLDEGGYRGSVCNVHCAEHIQGITIEERNANARLIAAAPDLLDALIELKEWIENDCGAECPSDKARDAIAKAEGRS